MSGLVLSRRQMLASVVSAGLFCTLGCRSLIYRFTTDTPPAFVTNPVSLPALEDTFVWLQVVDVVDDYFHIKTEQPVQNRGEIVLEGHLETSYRAGATLSEPWRKDSTSGFERLQSTFQSIRRRCFVTVRPQSSAYEMEVIVQKELEETDSSQFATESVASPRREVTINRTSDSVDDQPRTVGWIPLGRDTSLEQVILQDILGRLTRPDAKRHLHHP